jgi:hypothetical protein
METVLNAILDMLYIMVSVFFLLRLWREVMVRNKAQNAAKESTVMRKTRVKAKAVKALVSTLAK